MLSYEIHSLTHAGGAERPRLLDTQARLSTKNMIRTSQFILVGVVANRAAVIHDRLSIPRICKANSNQM